MQAESGHAELFALLLVFRDPQEAHGVLVPAGEFFVWVGGNGEVVGVDGAGDVSIFKDPMIGLKYSNGKGIAFVEKGIEFFRSKEQCGDG